MTKSAQPRIGIVEADVDGWIGGAHYTRMLAQFLGEACRADGTDVVVLCRDTNSRLPADKLPARVIPLTPTPDLPGKGLLNRLLGLPHTSTLLETARQHQVSVLLPLLSVPEGAAGLKTIGWIPDFQHVHLPEYFSEADCRARDERFRQVAERADIVMLTSEHAREHFVAFAPEHAHKARVASFPSLLVSEAINGDPASTVQKFKLPRKFALVANQFWLHKNHQAVVEAVSHLRRKDIRVPVVMTGLPADYRDPDNQAFSQMLQAIAQAGLGDQITVLGLVSDADLVDLMRTAAVIIQPSRFEGWSTVVQNAKALGRPLICSDIPTHREQAPDALGFFPCDRADTLAELLGTHWSSLRPGPDPLREQQALAAERVFASRYGKMLLKLCQEVCTT